MDTFKECNLKTLFFVTNVMLYAFLQKRCLWSGGVIIWIADKEGSVLLQPSKHETLGGNGDFVRFWCTQVFSALKCGARTVA